MNIRLDWVAYYKRFKQVHGGNPVAINGTLLFSDGWRYSDEDVQGPEYPPPTDECELQFLQRDYWSAREEVVQEELTGLERSKSRLVELQAMKSAPLQHVVYQEDEEGHNRREIVDLELQGMDGRIQWLHSDLQECKRNLQGLTNGDEIKEEQPIQRVKQPRQRKVVRAPRPTITKQSTASRAATP